MAWFEEVVTSTGDGTDLRNDIIVAKVELTLIELI